MMMVDLFFYFSTFETITVVKWKKYKINMKKNSKYYLIEIETKSGSNIQNRYSWEIKWEKLNGLFKVFFLLW